MKSVEIIEQSVGAAGADAFGLGVYSRWGFPEPLVESLHGLRDLIPQKIYADLKATYTSLRDAKWQEASPGHLAQIVDELVGLSDVAAKEIDDLKPFYDFGVLLGDIVVEGNKLDFHEADRKAAIKLLHDLPKNACFKPLPKYLANYSRLVCFLSNFVNSDTRFQAMWHRTRPKSPNCLPQFFIETMIESLHLHARWVLVQRSIPLSDDSRLKKWVMRTYKRPEIRMPKLMEMMAQECKERGWDEVSKSTVQRWFKELDSDERAKIQKPRGRPKKSTK